MGIIAETKKSGKRKRSLLSIIILLYLKAQTRLVVMAWHQVRYYSRNMIYGC